MNFKDYLSISLLNVLALILMLLPFKGNANDWGKIGHRVIGEIAEENLSDSALTEVMYLLNGESMATASTWADEMRSNPDFRPYDAWHYVNLPLDKEYNEIKHNPKGDVIQTINKCIEILKDSTSNKQTKTFYLKYLIHTVGDLHQPLHTGRYSDYGGSKIKLQFMGRKASNKTTNLHVLWDSDMIDDYKMGYKDFANHLMRTQQENFQQGNAEVWANESHTLVKDIYANINEGDKIGYDYIYTNFPTVKLRLYQAGIRLAGILNEIYL